MKRSSFNRALTGAAHVISLDISAHLRDADTVGEARGSSVVAVIYKNERDGETERGIIGCPRTRR